MLANKRMLLLANWDLKGGGGLSIFSTFLPSSHPPLMPATQAKWDYQSEQLWPQSAKNAEQ